jgi:hypothetical protein
VATDQTDGVRVRGEGDRDVVVTNTSLRIGRDVRPMPSRVSDVVFSEPSGRRHAFVMFAGALVLAGLYVYYGVLGESTSIGGLFLLVGCVLSGIAESLPTDRRRTAGVLRVTAILVLGGLLATVAFAPELVVGPR